MEIIGHSKFIVGVLIIMIKNKLLFIGIGFFLLILSNVLTLFQILRTDISSTVVTQQHSNKQLQKQQDVITGTFISQHNFLGMIVLPIQKTDIPYDEIIEFRIRKETDTNWYYSGEFETARVNNLDFYPLGFPVVTDSANQHFYFEIEKVKKSNANPITFNLKNDYFQTKYQYPTQTLLQDPVQLFTFFTAKTQYAIANEISSFTFIINFIPFFIFIFWRYIRMLFVLLKKNK